ncbi:MAG: 30S ribosomal protein S16 [Acidimicrobiia bacterium]
MAVKIRLMRVGKKKQPSYRVVVADGRSPRDGRYIEIIGQYAPRQEPSFFTIDDEKALAWLKKGAQPTDQVQKLLAENGVWERYQSERGQSAALVKACPKRTAPKLSKKAQARAVSAADTPAEVRADAEPVDAPAETDAPEAGADDASTPEVGAGEASAE